MFIAFLLQLHGIYKYNSNNVYNMHRQSCDGEYNLGLIVRVIFGNFAKIGRAAGASPIWQNFQTSRDYLFIISMSRFQRHAVSPKPSLAILSTSISCFCLFFRFLLFLLMPLAQLNLYANTSFRHFVCFGKMYSSTINEITVLLSTNQHPVILSC